MVDQAIPDPPHAERLDRIEAALAEVWQSLSRVHGASALRRCPALTSIAQDASGEEGARGGAELRRWAEAAQRIDDVLATSAESGGKTVWAELSV